MGEDQVIWIPSKKGEFSVSQAYFFAVAISKSKSSTSSNPYVGNIKFWKFIWSSSLPIRVSVDLESSL